MISAVSQCSDNEICFARSGICSRAAWMPRMMNSKWARS